ncbi:unnamed protein product [Phytomonas sp. EM1]|nr:unnamed protein product [Phytomonas sp. EM1]|eukprot:CCW62519.1 unnamed protein product [Phytomonas sp. isolate EM1]
MPLLQSSDIPVMSVKPEIENFPGSTSKFASSPSRGDSQGGKANTPSLAQLDPIHQPLLDEIECYDTPTHCHLIGTDCDHASYHIISFPKKTPVIGTLSESIMKSSEDSSSSVLDGIHSVDLPTIGSAKTQKNSNVLKNKVNLEMKSTTLTHDEMISFVNTLRSTFDVGHVQIRVLLGTIYLTKGYYLVVARNRQLVARIGPHRIFKATDITLISLMTYPKHHGVSEKLQPQPMTSVDATTSAYSSLLEDNRNNSDGKSYEKPRKHRWWDVGNISSTVASLVTSVAPNFFGAHRDPEEHYRQQLISLFADDKNNSSFYYSHTYDLTNTLQTNMTVPAAERMYRMKYVWNEFLMEPFSPLYAKSNDERNDSPSEWFSTAFPHPAFGSTTPSTPAFLSSFAPTFFHELGGERRWCVFVIRGAIIQHILHTVPDFLPFSLTLITRVSKEFTGTRYLRRGIDRGGHAANHVEVEQIVCEEFNLDSHYLRGGYSSYVQVRGSVPLRWFHPLPIATMLKPPIVLSHSDGLYTETCRHFQHLLADYGAPIVVMDYLKQMEKQERESTLGAAYRVAVQVLAGSIDRARKRAADPFKLHSESAAASVPEPCRSSSDANTQINHLRSEAVLRYKAIDLRRAAGRSWNVVTAAAEEDEADIGLFVCQANGEVQQRQQGVVRSNCIDCVDRTNIGQLIFSLHALGRQLEALGLLHVAADLVLSPEVQEALVSMYLFLGDAIATQYGGSPQVSVGVLHRGVGWDQFMGIKRLFNNMMSDEYKQGALNLFLGIFRPYLHPGNRDPNVELTSSGLRKDSGKEKGSALSFPSSPSFVDPTTPDKVLGGDGVSTHVLTSTSLPVPKQSDQHSEDSTESLASSVASNPVTTFLLLSTSPSTTSAALPRRSRRLTARKTHTHEPRVSVGGEAEPDYYSQANSDPHLPGSSLLKHWWIAPLAWWRHTCGRRLKKGTDTLGNFVVNEISVERVDSLHGLIATSQTLDGANSSLVSPLLSEARRQRELSSQEMGLGPSLEDYVALPGNTSTNSDNAKYQTEAVATPLKSSALSEGKSTSANKVCTNDEVSVSQALVSGITTNSFAEMEMGNPSPAWQPRQQPILLRRSTRCAQKNSTFSLLDNEKAVLKALRTGASQNPFFCFPIWNIKEKYGDNELLDSSFNELDNVQKEGTDHSITFTFPKMPTAPWCMREYVHDHSLFPSQVHTSVYEVQQKKLEEDIYLSDDDKEIKSKLGKSISHVNPDMSTYFNFQAHALLCLLGTPVNWTNDEVKAALRYCAATSSSSRPCKIPNLICNGPDLLNALDHSLQQPSFTVEQRRLVHKLRALARYLHPPMTASPLSTSVKDPSVGWQSSDLQGEGPASPKHPWAPSSRRATATGWSVLEGGPVVSQLDPVGTGWETPQSFFLERLTPQTVGPVLSQWVEHLREGVPRRDYIRYTTQPRRTQGHTPNRLLTPVIVRNAFPLVRVHRWLIENSEACGLKLHMAKGGRRAAAIEAWRLLWWAAHNSLIVPIVIDPSPSSMATFLPIARLRRSRDCFFSFFSDPTTLFRFPGVVDAVKLNWPSVEENSILWVQPLGRGVPRGISDQVPPTILIEKLSSLALNAISEFQREIVTGSLSLADSVKMAKVLLESIETGAKALRNVDLRLIPTAERLCFFINLYNTLYAHAWMAITARGYTTGSILVPLNGETTMALPTNLIEDFYRTHGYVIGSHWLSCYTIKYGILTALPPPPTATSKSSSGDAFTDELLEETSLMNGHNGIDAGYAAGRIEACQVDIDLQGLSQALIDVGLRCSAHIFEPLSTVGSVSPANELSSLICDTCECIRHDVKFYLLRRIILALLDTYLPPPPLLPDGAATWEVRPYCLLEWDFRGSCDALAYTESEKDLEPRYLFEMKSSPFSPFDFFSRPNDTGSGSTDRSPSQNAWTMLGTATMQVIAAVGATNDPYWGLSLFQRRTQTPISRHFFSRCPSGNSLSPLASSSSSRLHSLTHLCLPLVASASTMYGYSELVAIEKDFVYSVQQARKSKPVMLSAMLTPILIQYPDIFGPTSDTVLQRLRQSQQSAIRAEKCRQTCMQKLEGL